MLNRPGAYHASYQATMRARPTATEADRLTAKSRSDAPRREGLSQLLGPHSPASLLPHCAVEHFQQTWGKRRGSIDNECKFHHPWITWSLDRSLSSRGNFQTRVRACEPVT